VLALGLWMFGTFLPVFALPVDAPLEDPKLESQAVELSKTIRCVVCQGESIYDSNAVIAQDLRKLIRARLLSGEKPQDIRDYIVSSYGDYVLLSPPFKESTYLLWLLPLFFLMIGGGAFYLWVRGNEKAKPTISE
jgi:cytochrome c-type biogenesis protein CcmH